MAGVALPHEACGRLSGFPRWRRGRLEPGHSCSGDGGVAQTACEISFFIVKLFRFSFCSVLIDVIFGCSRCLYGVEKFIFMFARLGKQRSRSVFIFSCRLFHVQFVNIQSQRGIETSQMTSANKTLKSKC